MKLHLPTRLRAAVLACFAVVTSFSTTLATGAIAGGAFAVTVAALVAPQAEGANYTWTNTEEREVDLAHGPWRDDNGNVLTDWTNQVQGMIGAGTNTLVFVANPDAVTYNTRIKYTFSNTNIAGITVNSGATGYVVNSSGNQDRKIILSAGTYTFNESFTWNTSTASNGTMTLNGAQTWTVANGKTFTLNSGRHNIALNGAITQNGGTVQLSGGSAVTGNGSYTVNNGTLNLGGKGVNDADVTLRGQSTLRNGTFGSGVNFAVNERGHTIGDITFNNGALDISVPLLQRLVADDQNALLRTEGTITFGSNVKIELGVGKIADTGNQSLQSDVEYRIFSNGGTINGWTALNDDNFRVNGQALPCNISVRTTDRGLILVRRIRPDVAPTLQVDGILAGEEAKVFTWNDETAMWKKDPANNQEYPVASSENSCILFDSNAIVRVGDVGETVTVRELLICGCEQDTNVVLEGGSLEVTDGIVVQKGANFILFTEGGRRGSVRGEVTVKDGSTMWFKAENQTGYGGEHSMSSITIESGATLLLSNSVGSGYEKFAGTLNLDGSLLDDVNQEGISRWDMYGGNSSINVGVGKTAEITAGLRLAQTNSNITVGDRSSLTLEQTISKSADAAGNLIKKGNGSMTVNGIVEGIGNVTVQQNGTLTLNGAVNDIGDVSLEGGTATTVFNGGGSMKNLYIKGGNAQVNFNGIDAEYHINFVTTNSNPGHVKNDNNRGRLFSVGNKTEVYLGANDAGYSFQSDYGTNIHVLGKLHTEGVFYLKDASTDDIYGSGEINAAALQTGNAGNYNFRINTFNVTGATTLGHTINVVAGNVNLMGSISGNGAVNVGSRDSNSRLNILNDGEVEANIRTLYLQQTFGDVYVGSDENQEAALTVTNSHLTKRINNDNGKLTLTGDVNIVHRIDEQNPANSQVNITRLPEIVYYERVLTPVEDAEKGKNGYRADYNHYGVATNDDNLTFGPNAVGKVNGNSENVTLGSQEFYGEIYHVHHRWQFDPNTYWVNLEEVKYNSGDDRFDPATNLRLNGRDTNATQLTLETNLADGLLITIQQESSTTLRLEEGVELDYDQLNFDIDPNATIKLTGEGRYVQPSGSMNTKVTGLTDEANWHGTIVMSGELDKANLNLIGNINSTVELTGVTGTLATGEEINVNVGLVNWAGESDVTSRPGMNITGGEDNEETRFNREVSGSGDLVYSGSQDRSFVFTNEVTDWTGSLVVSGTGNTTVKFTGDDEINVSLNHNSDANRVLNVILDNSAAEVLVMNGDINASTLTVAAGTTADITGNVELTGKLTVDGKTTLHSLFDTTTEDADDLCTITEADVNAELVLAGYADFNTVNVGVNGALTMDLNALGIDTLSDWDSTNPLLTIGTLNGINNTINVNALANTTLLLTLRDHDSIVLAEIENCNPGLTLAVNNGERVDQSIVVADNAHYRYTYSLVSDNTTGITQVILSAERTALGWIGSETDEWLATDTADQVKWADDGYDGEPKLDPYSGAVGYFSGNGSATVNVGTDGARADMLIVSVIPDTFNGTTEYTLQGGKVTVDGGAAGAAGAHLVVNSGSLVINNEKVDVLGNALVSTLLNEGVTHAGKLTVKTELDVAGKMELIGAVTFDNQGTTSVDGAFSVSSDATVTNSGVLKVGSIAAEDVTITSTGTLDVGEGGGSIGTLAGTGSLKNSGVLNIASDTELSALENSGTLKLGDKKLTVTASSITTGGTVEAGSAELADAIFTKLTVTGAVTADNLEMDNGSMGSLDADSLTVHNAGKVTVTNDATLGTFTNTGEITVGGKLTATSDVTTGGIVKAGSAELADASFTKLTVTGDVLAGDLEVDNGSMGSLQADSLTSLTAGKVTVSNDATLETFNVNGQFIVGGKLTATDTVVTGGTVVAADAELADATFDTLSVTGTVKADDLSVKKAEIGVLDASSLTVVENGTALVKSPTTLGAFDNLGTVNIDGDLTVNSDVVNGGSVVADNITVQGDSNFTQVTTDTLQTVAATIAEGTITTLATDALTVNGGTVSVKDDVTLSLLAGEGKLKVDDKVTLTDTTNCSVDVTARTLELATSGNTLGEVTVDTITMAEGILLNETDVVLATDAISSRYADTIAIDVSDSAFAALSKDESGRYTEADYLILTGADADDVFVNKNAQQMQDIRRTGACADMLVNSGVLSLSISAITDENGNVVDMLWDTTGGNTLANNGYEIISGGAGFYKSLDYVQQVIVTDDRTFDLSTGAVGDSISGNASEPLAGLLVRNLRGGGTLTVKGNSSAVDTATFFNTDGKPTTAEEAVGLTADAATVNLGLPKGSNGYLVEDAGSEAPTLASLRLVNSAQVNVNNSAEVLGDTDLQGFSRLYVMEGSTLTTRMLFGSNEAEIKGDIVVTKGGKYTGTYDEARITAKSGSNLSLRTGGCRGLGLTAEDGTTITLDSAGQHGSMTYLRAGANPMMRLAGNASTTINVLNATKTENGYEHSTVTVTSESGNYINKSTLTLSLGIAETARTLGTPGAPVVFDGAVNVTDSNIVVNLLGDTVKNGALDMGSGEEKNLTLAYIVSDGEVENNKVTFAATPELEKLMSKYYTNMRLESDGAIRVDRVADFYSSELKLSDNAQVGIDMADAALVKLTPQGDRDNYKDLAGVLDTLDAVIASGDTAAAEELGAAVSGASIAALGVAVAGDVERQLMAIRNRTTTMGVDQSQVNESMPYFNAWINAEGDFRRLDADKSLPGYELNSWGGTVGFDVDMTPRLTMGLAATAMYGDFTAESADKAEGDLDTYYVTAFARYAANRWSHTFVATVGTADTSLQRTVTHANGNYTAEGSGDAVSFGFMYEVGYVVAMNESATACLQPVFNVMLAHSSLDGYSEEKSDAALRTNGVDMTTVTFGMGARTQAIVGENLYNRASMVEARALVKVRAGDREGETENALDAVPNAMGKVTTAEMGTVGAEFGVGLTVPMGATGGSVFADASVEISSGYTNVNGTVGYRINF